MHLFNRIDRKALGAIMLVITITGTISCAQSDRRTLATAEAAAKEADSLRAVVDSIVNGPSRKLAALRRHFIDKEFELAEKAARLLIAQHPESQERTEADSILASTVKILSAKADSVQRAQSKARDRAMRSMVKQRDEMRSVTFWRDRASPARASARSWIGAYIVDPDYSRPNLRMVIYYRGSDWLFIQRYLVRIDGNTHWQVPDDYGAMAVERDNGYEGIWEWWDVPAESEKLRLLRDLADAKAATIRYEGRQYYRDRTIGQEERAALKRTLTAYDELLKQ